MKGRDEGFFLFLPVIKFYWQNKDLKEELYVDGIIRHIKNRNSWYLLRNILISMYRLKTFLVFKRINRDILSVRYGLKSSTQKMIVNGNKDGVEYYNKLPMGSAAKNSLLNESEAIEVFKNMGVKTMEKFDDVGDFCYLAVKGVSKYAPDKIFSQCVSKYPTLEKIRVSDYLFYNESSNSEKLKVDGEIELTVSHGDLTVWNTFYDNGSFTVIDLEFFSKRKVRYYDIFYYILSYEFYVNRSNSRIIYENLITFARNHNIDRIYIILFLHDLIGVKRSDAKDGHFLEIKFRLIEILDQLIDIYEDDEIE